MSIFNKIKQAIVDATEKVSGTRADSTETENTDFQNVIVATRQECLKMNEHFYTVKLSDVEVYKNNVQNWSDGKKTDFLLYCLEETDTHAKQNRDASPEEYKDNLIRDAYLTQLLRAKIRYQDEGIIKVVDAFLNKKRYSKWSTFNHWPVALFINQLLTQYKTSQPVDEVKATLDKLRKACTSSEQAAFKEIVKLKPNEMNCFLSRWKPKPNPLFF